MYRSLTRRAALTVAGLTMLAGSTLVTQASPARQASLIGINTTTKFGPILANAQGMSLYSLSSEAGGAIKCSGGCLKFWPPLLVPAGTTAPTSMPGASGTFGTVTRSDGSVQLTYNGFPLYTFANDRVPGDTNGEGIQAFGGTWRVDLASAGIPLSATAMVKVTINITTTGSTVWGKVTLSYAMSGTKKTLSCAKSACTLHVPMGVTLHLSQTATNATTWPFSQWQVKAAGSGKAMHMMGATAKLKVTKPTVVTAVYVVG